jgi:hypothetical protein
MTLSIMTLSIMTLSIMTLSIMTLSIMTLSIIAPIITTNNVTLSITVMLSVVNADCRKKAHYGKCCYDECHMLSVVAP